VKGEISQQASIVYPSGKRVQLEVVFNEIQKSAVAQEQLELVKAALINAQQVLRVEDAICIVDQRKKDPIILDPNPIINKKKILRKIAKPKPVKKVKVPQLPPAAILFGQGKDDVNINHLVLVEDANLDLSLAGNKINGFLQNGGSLTLFFIGNEEAFETMKSQLTFSGKVNVYHAAEISSDQMVRVLLSPNQK
jgi:hypothetical protein